MTTPKGPTPSLIGTTLGSCSFVRTGSKGKLRTCKRCRCELPRDAACIDISIPGTMNHKKPFCLSCFSMILDATQRKLDALRATLTSVQP